MTWESTTPSHGGIEILDGGITILAGYLSEPKFVSHHWWGLESVPQLGCAFIRLVKEVVYFPLVRTCPDKIEVAAILHLHGNPPPNPGIPPYDDGALLLYLEERLHALRCVDRFFRNHRDFEHWAAPAPGVEERSDEELIRSGGPVYADEQVVMVIHEPVLNAWAVPIPTLSLETQASLARTVRTAMISVLGEVVPASLIVELMTPVLYS